MPHDYSFKVINSVFFILFIFCLISCDPTDKSSDLEQYQYKQTKELVYFVREAAKHLSKKGTAAYEDFATQDGKWFNGTKYIFIYDTNGTCVFHPIDKHLIGRNDISLRDINGKPIIEWLIKTAMHSPNHEGWVHYLWSDAGTIFPYWKSSYVTKVTDAAGNTYILGSGLYNTPIENIFLTSMVDSAAALIEQSGDKAFDVLKDKASEYNFADLYIYAFTQDGNLLVDPSFPSVTGRNILNIQDAAGKYFIKDMISALANKDKAWIMYLWPKPNESKPSKKIAYARKVRLGDRIVIISSDKYEEKEIWIKD
jgi:signal transduction histidine kinase